MTFPVPVATGNALGILGYGIGIILGALSFSPNKKPRYQMKLQKNTVDFGNRYSVSMRCIGGYPSQQITKHHNIDCLKSRGHFVKTESVYTYYRYWTNVANIYHDDIEKILADCKDCNVYTEVVYERTNIFGNEVQESQTLYWHKHYQK